MLVSKWKNNDKWWVSSFNFKDEVTKQFEFQENIQIHDATLRDGEQTPGVVLRKHEKIETAKRLAQVGVQRIEAGMPAVSAEDRDAIAEINKLDLNSKIFSFVRAKEEDLLMSKECGVEGVIIEVPIGKPKLEMQFKWEVDRVIHNSIAAIKKAKELGLYTVYFPYDTTRADEADLEKVLDEIMKETPPDSIGLVDTMGSALPATISYMTKLIKSLTGLPVEIHTHNDFGLALANSLSALTSGASAVHTCVNGMGERTGNCSLEEVIVVLKILYGLETNYDIEKAVELSEYLEKTTGYKMALNKPVVGKGNFTRESGIGADTLLNTPLAMFALNPEFLGRSPKLVLGKKSGLASINVKLNEMGIVLDDEKKRFLLNDVKQAGQEMKRLVSDEEFLKLVSKYKKV
ncbi:MAG: 2-isopropylmalate synthase [Bacillota bacterium]